MKHMFFLSWFLQGVRAQLSIVLDSEVNLLLLCWTIHVWWCWGVGLWDLGRWLLHFKKYTCWSMVIDCSMQKSSIDNWYTICALYVVKNSMHVYQSGWICCYVINVFTVHDFLMYISFPRHSWNQQRSCASPRDTLNKNTWRHVNSMRHNHLWPSQCANRFPKRRCCKCKISQKNTGYVAMFCSLLSLLVFFQICS